MSDLSSLLSEATCTRLKEETTKDSGLTTVINCLQNNFPIEGDLRALPFELSVIAGMRFKGARVVIPKGLRQGKRLHEGHLGSNKCKVNAQNLMFWPGMSLEIQALIEKSATCKEQAHDQPAERLLIRHNLPQP